MANVERAKAYLRAIENGEDPLPFFAADAIQREFPNQLMPNGATRDVAALQAGRNRGASVVEGQRYEITNALEVSDQLALEVIWTAKLKVPLGKLAVGDTIRAHFGVFITYRDGLIISQRNYDCFDPF